MQSYTVGAKATPEEINSAYIILCIDISEAMNRKFTKAPTTLWLGPVWAFYRIYFEIIENCLSYLANFKPNKKICLVAFNDKIFSYICDGITDEVIIDRQHLNTKLGMIVKANLTGELKKIKKTWPIMKDKLWK